jgi:hypothetical protein
MDRRIPNEDERKKLQKMAHSQQQFPIYALGLTSVFGIVIALFNRYPIVASVLTVATLIATVYLKNAPDALPAEPCLMAIALTAACIWTPPIRNRFPPSI